MDWLGNQQLPDPLASLCCCATMVHVSSLRMVFVVFCSPYLSGTLLATFPSIVTVVYALFEPCLRLCGEGRDTTEKRIKSSAMYLGSDLSFDEKRYEELSKQANLIALVESMLIAQKECLEIREKILDLKGFQFNG
jgi:hypothetical protein